MVFRIQKPSKLEQLEIDQDKAVLEFFDASAARDAATSRYYTAAQNMCAAKTAYLREKIAQ